MLYVDRSLLCNVLPKNGSRAEPKPRQVGVFVAPGLSDAEADALAAELLSPHPHLYQYAPPMLARDTRGGADRPVVVLYVAKIPGDDCEANALASRIGPPRGVEFRPLPGSAAVG